MSTPPRTLPGPPPPVLDEVAVVYDELEERRRTSTFTREDTGAMVGCGLASLALTWLVFYRLTLFSGALGFAVVWLLAFLAMYWLVLRETEDRVAAVDKVMMAVVATGAFAVVLPLTLIIGYTVFRGLPGLNSNFFTQSLQFAGPLDPPEVGGMSHAIVGSLEQVGIAILVSVPLGILTAVFLNEVGGTFRRPVRIFVDAMSGTPSIVAGLFIYAVLILPFDRGFFGFAAALALSVLMLPTVTRTAEEVLRLVPGGLREASLALGAPRWKTTWSVVLPTARSGLITAALLGVARAVGETAPLIMTTLGQSSMNYNPFSGPQSSLPLQVFQLLASPLPAQIQRAWTGALVLIVIVLVLFALARTLGGRRPARRGAATITTVVERVPE